MQTVKIGLLGLGTVGTGVVRVLRDNAADIEGRLGARIEVRRIAVGNLEKRRAIELPPGLLTERASDVLDDPEISVIVELIGGTGVAREHVLAALDRGKHVVTANKTLLAHHGREIFARASAHGADVFYEAAVGGGVPIIRALRESLASERIQRIAAIVNGTTNFILTAMAEEKRSLEDALRDAQERGFAEADPTADVDGHDAAEKLAILASLGFSTHLSARDVEREGIRSITSEDLANAEASGYRVKLLALAERHGDAVTARVHPCWVPSTSMLAHVGGVLNAVMLESDALGTSMFIGQGAGQLPTGSAVVADLIDVARNVLMRSSGRVPHLATRAEAQRPARVFPSGQLTSAYYLRFTVVDTPGVLARIASCLGDQGVSLRVVRQDVAGDAEGAPVSLMVITHPAPEANVHAAIQSADTLATTRAPTRWIRILR